MTDGNNLNQNQPQPASATPPATPKKEEQAWLPDDIAEIQLHAQQVSKSETGWQEESHQKFAEIRKKAVSPEIRTEEGVNELEEGLRSFGMPAIRDTEVAFDQMDKREEAMIEERSLREQGRNYNSLSPENQKFAQARIYNGVNFRKDWNGIYNYLNTNGIKFEPVPTTPPGKAVQRSLEDLVTNEVRLTAARELKLGLDFKDNERVAKITQKIVYDPEFIRALNDEAISPLPNTSNIKFEIKRRVEKYHETA